VSKGNPGHETDISREEHAATLHDTPNTMSSISTAPSLGAPIVLILVGTVPMTGSSPISSDRF
jgi:hypothetical protein